jgi:homoserine O-acetyltransferase
MVEAQYRLVTEQLGIAKLRLVMGTSMGGMQTWMWGERHPGAMDALMPLACLPVRIVGRNRLWRDMIKDAIKSDPAWNGGDYTAEPACGLRAAFDILLIAGSAPLAMQHSLAVTDSVDHYLDRMMSTRLSGYDANDLLYQVDASRDYDPGPELGAIQAPVMFVNSTDDFINPPELGIAEREIRRVPHGRFVLIPATAETHGHGTHTWPRFWKQYLAELLRESGNY